MMKYLLLLVILVLTVPATAAAGTVETPVVEITQALAEYLPRCGGAEAVQDCREEVLAAERRQVRADRTTACAAAMTEAGYGDSCTARGGRAGKYGGYPCNCERLPAGRGWVCTAQVRYCQIDDCNE